MSLRTSQVVTEALYQNDQPFLRTSQVVGEALYQNNQSFLRISQLVGEALYQNNDAFIRSTQSFMQVLYKRELNLFVPTSDISVGNWTPTPIFEQIDADDANCVVSEQRPANDQFEVGLSNIEGYDSSQLLQLRIIYGKVNSLDQPVDDGDTIDLTVEIREGNSTLETFTANDIRGSEPVTVLEVTPAGKGAIQNPSNLSVRVTANASTIDGSNTRACEICFLVAETTSPSVEQAQAATAAQSIDGSGVYDQGAVIVNYQNVGGQENIGWAKYPVVAITGDINAYGLSLGGRLRSQRYYGGDGS